MAAALATSDTSIANVNAEKKIGVVAGDSDPVTNAFLFAYENGAAGAIFYSREAPVFFQGLSFSAIFGQAGVITFESNGGLVVVRGRGLPRVMVPGLRDIRGYQAMHGDFAAAIRTGRAPEMSLERAMHDQRLMEQIYAGLAPEAGAARPPAR